MDELNFFDNKKLNQREIEERKVILKSFPTNLIVTLSSRCNLHCIMCEVRRINWEIPPRVIEEIISMLPYLESISWQGGEPFYLEYFDALFDRAAASKNIKQTIVTNGLLINERWAHKLANNNVELTFSIDGVTKEVYERIRRGAEFENVIRSVKLIKQARKESASPRITTRLHVVIMRSNYHQLEEFLDFAKEHEFDAVHFMPIGGNCATPENIFDSPDKAVLDHISAGKKKIQKKAENYNLKLLDSLPVPPSDVDSQAGHAYTNSVSVGIAETENTKKELLCYLPWQQMNVDPGGEVRPGCLCQKVIGNILNDTLVNLWNGQAMQAYRKKIIDTDYEGYCIPACSSGQIPQGLRRNR